MHRLTSSLLSEKVVVSGVLSRVFHGSNLACIVCTFSRGHFTGQSWVGPHPSLSHGGGVLGLQSRAADKLL